ncbi:Fur family transcriptional regulator [Kushneria phosphatilytica]|uniref:Ferric uptake regulation protein n=1 Tax=Kushneria phosphatilytica TaxID=657387 RepID=A0A1S1P0B9_9GAMM|nr:Fur family transcriptional regulator [Kushneria phosphatilytica]OHV11925.1 transcriptional repressor [Kushneria phosphatilytica]QEL11107.1 transcriptional repressor [Kushneria phosphatilytica]
MSDTDTLVRIAEQRCQDNGSRFTPIRRRVFEMISDSPGGLKAYELLDRLSNEHASARPPTVYRALDFLSEQGLIHRIESRNAYIACPCPEHARGFQLMICRHCGRVEELHEHEVVNLLEQIAARHDFRIERQTIELSGLCHECRE